LSCSGRESVRVRDAFGRRSASHAFEAARLPLRDRPGSRDASGEARPSAQWPRADAGRSAREDPRRDRSRHAAGLMSATPRLPLAAAAARLSGTPGRPRTRPERAPAPIITSTPVMPAITVRVVDLAGAALYLGLSTRAVRGLIDSGQLRRVRIE